MIKGITGVPGSGKSYFAVKLVTDKYFKWNKLLLEWEQRNKKKPVTIFSNVSGLKLPHISLDNYFHDKSITYEQFFTVPYMEKVIEKYGRVLILLDEAQKFVPSDYRNTDVLFFFQYHRHLGIDIILTFQTWFSISRKVTDLMEFEIRAVRRSFSIVGELRYHYYFGNERHGGMKLHPDHNIFALYKSFEQAPNEKPPQPVKKLILLILVAILVFFVGWKYFLGMFEAPKKFSTANISSKPAPVSTSPLKDKGRAVLLPGEAVPPSYELPLEPVRISVTRVQLGGFWYGNKLIAVDFFGHLVNVEDLQYQYQDDYENHKVYVMVPDSILAQIKTAKPDEKSLNGFYEKSPNNYQRVGNQNNSETEEKSSIQQPKTKNIRRVGYS